MLIFNSILKNDLNIKFHQCINYSLKKNVCLVKNDNVIFLVHIKNIFVFLLILLVRNINKRLVLEFLILVALICIFL